MTGAVRQSAMPKISEHAAAPDGHGLRGQAPASQDEVPAQPVEHVQEAAAEHAEPPPQIEEYQATAEQAEAAAHVDGAMEHTEEAPTIIEHAPEAPPLDPVGAMAAAPHEEYTPPG